MWKRISLDPCGPYNIRKHEDLRKGGELDVYFLMGADHATGAFLIQAMGSLQHPSVILAVKTMERRTGATFHWIHVDKGSSLSPALLESPHRDWTVIQACPTYHSSILVEGKIRQFRQFWNRFHRKFSKENKKAIILVSHKLPVLAIGILGNKFYTLGEDQKIMFYSPMKAQQQQKPKLSKIEHEFKRMTDTPENMPKLKGVKGFR